MRRAAIAALILSLLAGACRRERSGPVRVVTSAEVAGTGLPQRLLDVFTTSSSVPTQLDVVDGDSLRTQTFGQQTVVVITNDDEVVRRLRPRAWLAAPFARADFVIVGPKSDPADVKEAKTAAEAFSRIAKANRAFCSPVDVPRYRARAVAIWHAANVDPFDNRRYRQCRGGAARLLDDTAARFGYTLVDRSAVGLLGKEPRLRVLLEGTPMLRNDYTVLLLTQRRRAPRDAEWLVQWIMSYRGREVVDRHRIEGEKRFFQP